MSEHFQQRVQDLQQRMQDNHIDVALIVDEDCINYFSAYWGYLGMQFGRPTILVIPKSGECTIITPGMEAEMAREMTWIEDIREWADAVGDEWREHIDAILQKAPDITIGLEPLKTPPVVLNYLKTDYSSDRFADLSTILDEMRMIKSEEEIKIMRQAGQVSVAMCEGALQVIDVGVPEYEIALALISAGTRKAAQFLDNVGPERLFSPMIYNLPVLQSGPDLSMVHRRATTRCIQKGDPVYMCFCELTNFKGYKIGFDREYFVDSVTDEQAKAYETALKAQAAALDMIKPGAIAEEVHAASLEVYRENGYDMCYRSGRGIGYSYLEKPELKEGDTTILKPGMTFAVDGGITIPGEFGARVGDSVVVTDQGFEYLTPYPKELTVL